jgi:isopentenyl diphosphate isomerase/L-lactate dehydrogenase-like FMN-dependent dehydrogenase
MSGDLSCYNIADLRERARKRLPHGVWEYAERGTEDEIGMARNRAAFERVTFRPRVLRGVQSVDTSTTVGASRSPSRWRSLPPARPA